jgi:hypothetical protein
MPSIKKAFANVYLAADQRRRYEVLKGNSGWLFYEVLPTLIKDRLAETSWIQPGTYPEFGNTAESSVIAVDREHLKGILLRPLNVYLDEGQTQANFETTATDSTGADVPDTVDYAPSEDGLGTDAIGTQTLDNVNEPLTYNLTYSAAFCPNGFFAAGFKRQATPTEKQSEMRAANDYSDAGGCSIVFGGGKWMLYLPMNGPPQLYEGFGVDISNMMPSGFAGYWPACWVARPWTEGQLSNLDAQSLSGNGKLYQIGVMGHAICVTESDFENDFAYYVVPDRAQPIVPAGGILLSSWPGQCVLRLAPLMFQSALVWRYPFFVEDLALDRITGVIWGEQYIPTVVPGSPGGVQLLYAAVPGYPGYLQWTLEMGPIEYTYDESAAIVSAALDEANQDMADALGSDPPWPPNHIAQLQAAIDLITAQLAQVIAATSKLTTYSSPFVEALTIYQTPVVTDNGEPTFTEIILPYELGTSADLEASTAEVHSLVVDNRPSLAQWAQEQGWQAGLWVESAHKPATVYFRNGRVVKVEAGIIFDDDSTEITQIGRFHIVDVERGTIHAKVEMTDLLGMLGLARWRHGALCLRGFTAKAAIEFLLQLEGFGPDWYDIEDLGTSLLGGQNPDNDTWTYDEGTVLSDLLAEIVKYGMHNGVLFYDGLTDKLKTGCRYCRVARVAIGDGTWAQHQDNGWASSGCLAADAIRLAGTTDEADLVLIAGETAGADLLPRWDIAQELTLAEEILREGEYANVVQATGQAPDGRPLSAVLRNEDAIWGPADPGLGYGTLGRVYVGWQIARSEEVRHNVTWAAVAARALEMAAESFPYALVIRQGKMFLKPSLRPGMTCKIKGAEAMDGIGDDAVGETATGRIFRLTRVRRDVRGQRVAFEGREMVGMWPATTSSSSSSSS